MKTIKETATNIELILKILRYTYLLKILKVTEKVRN